MVAAEATPLAGALAAGLQDAGWSAGPPDPVGGVVLVAGTTGTLPVAGRLPPGRRPPVVAIGDRAALGTLAEAVARGAAAAAHDADQPFPDLVRAVDRSLRSGTAAGAPAPERDRLVAALRAREGEARRCAALTPREQDVLGAMTAGQVAAEIAATEHLSLATVRSHIRAVLAKLGVSSQVAAVALARRSCREPRVVARMRQVHQF